ncbi:hypothetical protein [Ralstonia pseudosolanacearum]|uniref:hypothetical protein n=1 Tax=Ralstonia pseudosolanacearum TaxID=1310165 RepID=UPI003AAD704A
MNAQRNVIAGPPEGGASCGDNGRAPNEVCLPFQNPFPFRIVGNRTVVPENMQEEMGVASRENKKNAQVSRVS